VTELELYKFLFGEDGLKPEMRWHGEELLCFIHNAWLGDFLKMIDDGFFDDGGYLAHLGKDYTLVDLIPLCEYFDINPENIWSKDEK
jgi:hypothetical protein